MVFRTMNDMYGVRIQSSLTGLSFTNVHIIPAMNRWAIFKLSLRDEEHASSGTMNTRLFIDLTEKVYPQPGDESPYVFSVP